MSMTSKERLKAAFRGEKVDRPPIWLREGFELGEPIPSADHFTLGWKDDKTYRDLFEYVSQYADNLKKWFVGPSANRFMLISPKYIETSRRREGNSNFVDGIIKTPSGNLKFTEMINKWQATTWHVKHVAETIEDLEKLISIPFEFKKEDIKPQMQEFKRVYDQLGDDGVVCFNLSSPIVAVSHCLTLEKFLELTITERSFIHELLEEVTRRTLVILDAVFENGNLDMIVNLGGSEQCTPPLMSPKSYDDFVVPYDGRIVNKLKKHGVIVTNHCHGKVRHALKCMVDMGIDATDPVEPPPQGDVTFQEAREIAGDKLTLMGNLEFAELENEDSEHIRKRIKEILSFGNRRLILAASGGPISPITTRLADNYRAWIETALEYGTK